MEKQYRFAAQRQKQRRYNKNRHFVREFEQTQWHLHNFAEKRFTKQRHFSFTQVKWEKQLTEIVMRLLSPLRANPKFKSKWIWDIEIAFEIFIAMIGSNLHFLSVERHAFNMSNAHQTHLNWFDIFGFDWPVCSNQFVIKTIWSQQKSRLKLAVCCEKKIGNLRWYDDDD